MNHWACTVLLRNIFALTVISYGASPVSDNYLEWSNLPDLPDPLGRAGVFVGIHKDALIIAGGANFPQPIWESQKIWHDDIYVLTKDSDSETCYQWHTGFKLPRPLAYGVSISTELGLVCMGGNDAQQTYADVFLLSWNPQTKTIETKPLPSLPSPCAYSAAASIGTMIYIAGGTSGNNLDTAMTNFWSLDLSKMNNSEVFHWQILPAWPGGSRAFNLVTDQFNGQTDCVYVMSGKRMNNGQNNKVEFLKDIYEFNPLRYNPDLYNLQTKVYSSPIDPWRRRGDLPHCVMAGTAIKVGQSHIFVFGGADGTFFGRENELKDNHPGFPKKLLVYHTITDTWVESDNLPANQVTTTAVRWGSDPVSDPIIIASGEIRPRVRSPKIWSALPIQGKKAIGWIDLSTIGLYLALMIGIGVFFLFRGTSTPRALVKRP